MGDRTGRKSDRADRRGSRSPLGGTGRPDAKASPRAPGSAPQRPAPGAPGPPDSEVRLGRRGLLWLGAAIGVIGVGFIALSLGSTTLAPILLVGGYLVLVPYALLRGENRV